MNQTRHAIPIVTRPARAPRRDGGAARRLWVIAAGTLLLCSCQTMTRQPPPDATRAATATITDAGIALASHTAPLRDGTASGGGAPDTTAPHDMRPATGAHASENHGSEFHAPAAPVFHHGPHGPAMLPASAFSQWATAPGPRYTREEYICNGGDQNGAVRVNQDWSLQGLDGGDTVVHYDTLDGEVQVQPSNNLCLYSPRFGAVRQVSGVLLHEQHQQISRLAKQTELALSAESESATTAIQPLQPSRNLGLTTSQRFRDTTRGSGLDNVQVAATARRQWLPFENLRIIRDGQFDNSEKPRLAASLAAAETWKSAKGLQVAFGNLTAVETSSDLGTRSVYVYQLPAGKSRLRVVKVASQPDAQPGDEISFTIRFDNVGDQVIGNVTVVDNLNTRLEYVDDSQSCDLEHDFQTSANLGESTTLRWEIRDPLEVGDGGVIRFKCLVR